MQDGPVTAETEEEEECFQLLDNLDYVEAHINRSVTNRKQMQNEIWSLTLYLYALTWFITFALADINHPICLYYAEEKLSYFPKVFEQDERLCMIARNPVAGAHFFHFIVEIFIKHVLRFKHSERGLYGKPAGYYPTVEQQGRLMLHLYMLVWIKHSLTPQEVQNNIMDKNSQFQKRMVQYLESVHIGEFINSTVAEMEEKISNKQQDNPHYIPSTETKPTSPIYLCSMNCMLCDKCFKSQD